MQVSEDPVRRSSTENGMIRCNTPILPFGVFWYRTVSLATLSVALIDGQINLDSAEFRSTPGRPDGCPRPTPCALRSSHASLPPPPSDQRRLRTSSGLFSTPPTTTVATKCLLDSASRDPHDQHRFFAGRRTQRFGTCSLVLGYF